VDFVNIASPENLSFFVNAFMSAARSELGQLCVRLFDARGFMRLFNQKKRDVPFVMPFTSLNGSLRLRSVVGSVTLSPNSTTPALLHLSLKPDLAVRFLVQCGVALCVENPATAPGRAVVIGRGSWHSFDFTFRLEDVDVSCLESIRVR